MPQPVFSVIIPCYECEATLSKAVRSVLAQSFADFEVLLLDDGSRDCTRAVAEAFAARDPRVRVLSHANRGVAATRNRGIAEARGALIAFLDADDWWEPAKLDVHLERHEADPDLDASFARIAFVPDTPGGRTTLSQVPAGRLSTRHILGENPVCTMSNLVVRADCFSVFDGFEETMSHAEDQEWLVRLLAGGGRIAGLNRLLVHYRTSESGLSSQLSRMHAGWRSFAYAYAPQREVRRYEALYCRYLARRALRLPGWAAPALGYTLRGLALDAAAFLSDPRRGLATALFSALAPLMPSRLRRRIFA
ncbi:glycosyltransferase family 2 protein [Novosphingobium profundi]|uniref:glycosyltransferase family 2 protein n=1 Tax=Novosphingobium profundi TaxID=1774954 RepID=UPI001BDA52B2|nr:glycosyltransferase family 2 protein [Novosphingobium profundi]MBT0670093.1 glycosyltransferase family 2 protein [Novosphingobium profundi]